MDVIEQALFQALSDCHSPNRFVVAYSGGKDSHVLLHALSQLRDEHNGDIQIQAFHVHHGLSAYASEWAEHCKIICDQLQIPLEVFHVQLDLGSTESLEALARQARYQIFCEAMEPGDYLLTAHTQDDQAETVLLHLLRGTGLQGLIGIHAKHSMGKGCLLRPLLSINRQQITDYATQHQLKWIEDDSNDSLVFRRNLIRHTVFPLLKKINPSFVKQFANCARLANEAQMLLDEYLLEDLNNIVDSKRQLIVSALLQYSLTKQKALVRYWIKQQGAVLPSEKKLVELMRQMLDAKDDKVPCVTWGEHEIRRYQGKLKLMPASSADENFVRVRQWDYHQPLLLASQEWYAEHQPGGVALHALTSSIFDVRFRQPGESVKLAGRQHHTKLKKLFQTLKIPPWERDSTPLFFQNGNLIAIGECWVSEKYRQSDSKIGLTIKKLVK